MSTFIPAAERLLRARGLIQKARAARVPAELGQNDLSYIAQVRDLLRQARDLVRFIPQEKIYISEVPSRGQIIPIV